MIDRIRSLYLILNLKTFAIVSIAAGSTYVCQQLKLFAEFPMTVVMLAVVFPIVFSIGAAYKRRERALCEYANLKAHGHAIYLATRDWVDEASPATLDEARNLFRRIFVSTSELLLSPVAEMRVREDRVYRSFSELSVFVRTSLRKHGMTATEVSRVNQYLSKMINSFEVLKSIYQYRTPTSLRTFSDFFLIVLPILYGPYFAHLGQGDKFWLAFVPPTLFSLVLVTLDNIQEHLENPFDQVGEDDIRINVDLYLERLRA